MNLIRSTRQCTQMQTWWWIATWLWSTIFDCSTSRKKCSNNAGLFLSMARQTWKPSSTSCRIENVKSLQLRLMTKVLATVTPQDRAKRRKSRSKTSLSGNLTILSLTFGMASCWQSLPTRALHPCTLLRSTLTSVKTGSSGSKTQSRSSSRWISSSAFCVCKKTSLPLKWPTSRLQSTTSKEALSQTC